jgi:hypothetical protein
MYKKLMIFLTGCMLILTSCSPKISTNIAKSYLALDYREEVRVFGVEDPTPDDVEVLGSIKIGDTGFSTNCDLDAVLDKAKTEARKIGGNALKITKHTPPSIWGSSCHRIEATILKVENLENFTISETIDSTLIDADYALLHVYRQSGTGALVGFDLHLGDTVICHVSNKWKETIKITKDGLNTLWARTETKTELPINIQLGKEYYIRCSVSMGAFVGRPKLEIIDNQIGKLEFQAIKDKTDKK